TIARSLLLGRWMASIATPSSVTRVVAVTTGLVMLSLRASGPAGFPSSKRRREQYQSGPGKIGAGTSRPGRSWGKLRVAENAREKEHQVCVAGPDRRHPRQLRRGDRSHRAAELRDADNPASRAVRHLGPLRADRDQPLRRH